MKTLKPILLIIITLLASCDSVKNHRHDGSYAISISMFGASLNSKKDLIINGDKALFNGEITDCKQFSDRIEVGNGKLVFTEVEGDLVVNLPTLGKVRFLKISGDNNLTP